MKVSNKFSMRILLSLFLVSCSSNEATYSLDWKIDDNAVVAYKTAMNVIDGTDSTFSFDFDELFAGNEVPAELTQQLSSLKLPESGSLISILERNPRGNISVKMIVDKVDFAENQSSDAGSAALGQLMEGMEGTVQLRGEITPDGEISSFYLEQQQRNLLAIFFELPVGPVKVGDNWDIDVNCISLGAGFIADSSERINRVEFIALSATPDGKPVAILEYVLAEAVDGNFRSPLSNDTTPISMTCSFIGQGQFLVEDGRWEQLVGEFAISSTGFMAANTAQHFALMLLKDIPQEYINLE